MWKPYKQFLLGLRGNQQGNNNAETIGKHLKACACYHMFKLALLDLVSAISNKETLTGQD